MMTDRSRNCIFLLLVQLSFQELFPVSGFIPHVPITRAPAEASRRTTQQWQSVGVFGSDSSFRRLLHSNTRRQTFTSQLHLSALVDPSGPTIANETRDTGSAATGDGLSLEDIDNGRRDEYPWSDIHVWTLRDQVPRYSIQVEAIDSRTQNPTIKAYVLWRTLAGELPELAGYPIPFLARRYLDILRSEPDRTPSSALQTVTEILPFLDEFEFTPSGGMTGRVYGVQGVADGTRIETSAVGNVEVTIPKGFVETHDGLLYELGRPVRRPTGDVYSLSSGRQPMSSAANFARSLATESMSSNLRQRDDSSWDPELTQFGALTAFVIAGALAFETLQHHLTVNVFWV